MHRSMDLDSYVKQRWKSIPVDTPNVDDILESLPSGITPPVNLVFADSKSRRKSLNVKPHSYSGAIPDRSFVKINDKISVSSPPLCLYQMSTDLSLIELIELAYEFCGTYTLSAVSDKTSNDDLYNLPPLTNTRELKAFTLKAEGMIGQKKVVRALRYIVDGSASPMETKLAMLLTLPYRLGGYELPAPELNKKIDIEKVTSRRSGKSYYKCDFFWNEAKLAFEYDSYEHHTDKKNMISDSEKRQDLAALGINVISVTNSQIQNLSKLDGLAELIAKKMKKRFRYDSNQFYMAQRKLYRMLFR